MATEKGRIFFLGAGFSAGAGIPLTNKLLPMAARLFQSEAAGLFGRVANYANEVDVDFEGNPNAEDFSKLCTHLEFLELREYAGGERWSSDGSREKVALKFYLAKAIALSAPESHQIPNHYLEFADSLTPDDIIVTFNWDLLLESALKKVGKAYSYNWKTGQIHILKLHGSINWINNPPTSFRNRKRQFGYQPLGYKDGLMENEIYSSEELHIKNSWHEAHALQDEVKPKIILPGYGKPFEVRDLAILWYRIEFLNLRQGGVSVIGLNISPDDFIVESLFRYLLRSVISQERTIRVLNPDSNVFDRFSKISGGRQCDYHCDVFGPSSLGKALLVEN